MRFNLISLFALPAAVLLSPFALAEDPVPILVDAALPQSAPLWDVALDTSRERLFVSTEIKDGDDQQALRRIAVLSRNTSGWSYDNLLPMHGLTAMGGARVDAKGRWLYFSGSVSGGERDLYRIPLSDIYSIPEQLTDTPDFGEIAASFAKDGQGYVWTDGQTDGKPGPAMYRVAVKGGRLHYFGEHINLHPSSQPGENSPAVSPDGRFLIYADYDVDPDGGAEDLFATKVSATGYGKPVSLGATINTPYNETSPAITPDGQTLLFASDRPLSDETESRWRLWSMNIDGIDRLASLNAATPPQPTLFELDALGQRGRITLTPSFTADMTQIYFAQSECAPIWECPQVLKTSRKVDGQWTTPEIVPIPRGTGANEPRVDYPEVSPDGSSLLMSWSGQINEGADMARWENFDLYRLDLTRPNAIPSKLVGPDLNRVRAGRIGSTRFVNNETAPSLTADGTLYFWSERLDGAGERDVYSAEPDGSGGFKSPELLPSPINSAGRDDGAWIHPSGRLMLLSYRSRGGEGGSDIFVSTRRGITWSKPENLGPSVNSPLSDFAAKLTPDNRSLIFSSLRGSDGSQAAPSMVWIVETDYVPVLVDALRLIETAG